MTCERERPTATRWLREHFPDRLRPLTLDSIAAATALTIQDGEVKERSRQLGSRCGRVITGDLAGAVFVNPVGQTSPAYLLGWFETHVAQQIRRFVQAGDTVFDIGANAGWHTIRLARCVGPYGRVLSFEPSATDRKLLELNIRANRLHNVNVDSRAVTDHAGTVKFLTFKSPGVHHVAREDSPQDGTVTDVGSISLDELIYGSGQPVPTFVKIDVEGGEVAVLRGARRLLTEGCPVIVVEVRRSTTMSPICSLALDLDYTVTELSDGETCDLLLTPPSPAPHS